MLEGIQIWHINSKEFYHACGINIGRLTIMNTILEV
jgi:hypothetical protein